MPAMNLKLAEITLDPEVQVRTAVDEDTVAAYAEALGAKEKFPPLLVFTDSERFLLADGFHRYEAAKRAGVKKFACEVRQGNKADAAWAALSANAKHGRPLTTAEKAAAITRALVLRPKTSDRAIAKLLGVSHSTVAEHRRHLNEAWTPGGRIGHLETREGADGKLYPVPPKPVITGTPPDVQDAAGTAVAATPARTKRGRKKAAAAASDASDVPVTLPAVVLDQVGQPVPAKMAHIFRRRSEITGLMHAVSKVKTAVLKFVGDGDELVKHIPLSRFEADAKNLYATLRFSCPHAICPYCRGEGCEACKGTGWVGEDTYKAAPASMKGGAR